MIISWLENYMHTIHKNAHRTFIDSCLYKAGSFTLFLAFIECESHVNARTMQFYTVAQSNGAYERKKMLQSCR